MSRHTTQPRQIPRNCLHSVPRLLQSWTSVSLESKHILYRCFVTAAIADYRHYCGDILLRAATLSRISQCSDYSTPQFHFVLAYILTQRQSFLLPNQYLRLLYPSPGVYLVYPILPQILGLGYGRIIRAEGPIGRRGKYRQNWI